MNLPAIKDTWHTFLKQFQSPPGRKAVAGDVLVHFGEVLAWLELVDEGKRLSGLGFQFLAEVGRSAPTNESTDERECSVGELCTQSALCSADRRVIVVAPGDEELSLLLKTMRAVCCYPDTTDENGKWNGTFKIELARKAKEGDQHEKRT